MNDDQLARTLIGQATGEERAQVQTWRDSSPENERHYQSLMKLLALASSADEERRPRPAPTAAEIIAAVDAELASAASRAADIATRDETLPAGRWRSVRWLAAAAAVLATLFGVSQWRASVTAGARAGFGVQQFVTGPDEQATVVLTDGTVVRLASDSRLNVPDDATGREVALVGRAYFAVAHDPARPFRVRTSAGEVRVLGTRFSLDTSTEDLRLVVVEGRVRLDTPDEPELEVGASQMARVVRGTRLPVVAVPDPILMTDWVGNFLAFQDTPLGSAVAEIEREYGVDITISDPELTDRTITAWFSGWSLDDVMEVVCVVAGAECDVGSQSVLMNAR